MIPVLDLARAMRMAEHNLRDAERRVERLLNQLFPTWKGWIFTPPDEIDVFQAADSAGAAQALHRHGFKRVKMHGHTSDRYLSCICKAREIP